MIHVSGYKRLDDPCKYSSRLFEVVESGVKIMIGFSSLSQFAIYFSVTSFNHILEIIQSPNELHLYCNVTRFK